MLADPWIADATILKLYPDRLQITLTEREAFALWQKDGRVSVIGADGTVLEPFVSRPYIPLPLVVGRGAEARAKEFLALLARYPEVHDNVRASILIAERRWNLRLKNGIDVRLPEQDIERRVGRARRTRSRQETHDPRRRGDRPAAARPRHRAAVRGCGAGARERHQGAGKGPQGRRRMSTLNYGLTPKMKPVSPRRSALVVALDIGTSKIACLIAKLRPNAQGEALRRRSHSIEVLGFSHTDLARDQGWGGGRSGRCRGSGAQRR